MPVSHLGLAVSHIPSAASFYLSALSPLGYRYIGSRGNSIGLGVHDADFFLTQDSAGYASSPTHIAFSAVDRSVVRQCYAAALNAGARPSGAPKYRDDDCNCFNAAVEDLDGNTVEFIWRDPDLTRPRGIARQLEYGRGDNTQSMVSSPRPAPTRSATYQSSDPVSSSPRSSGLQRSRTEPIDGVSSKNLVGVLLGAAAGVAVGYAMLSSEKDGAREEARHAAYVESRGRSDDNRRRTSRRSASMASSSRSQRDAMTASRRLPTSLAPESLRAIDSRSSKDDENISYIRTRVTRQSQGESRAVQAIEYHPSRFSTRRSATMPVENAADEASKHSGRRSSVSTHRSSRRDSVVSNPTSKSQRGQESRPRSSTSQASTIRPVQQKSTYYVYSAAQVPLPPSTTSKTATHVSTARPAHTSQFDAYYLPADDDGLGDAATIVPEDSISCVGLPRPRRRKSGSRKGSQAGRPGSVMTLPLRSGRTENDRARTAYSNV